MTINELLKLTPQKLLIYCLLTAISFLWYKLEHIEVKDDGKIEKQEKATAKKDSIIASLNLEIAHITKDCGNQLQAKDQEMIEDLKRRIALQEQVNIKAKEAEKKVDVVVKQTESKITSLTHEIQEKQN